MQYTRQTSSTTGPVPTRNRSLEARDDADELPLIFIRAPRITAVGAHVEVLARHRGEPVLLRDRNVTCATFHPELSADLRVHAGVFGVLTQKAMKRCPMPLLMAREISRIVLVHAGAFSAYICGHAR